MDQYFVTSAKQKISLETLKPMILKSSNGDISILLSTSVTFIPEYHETKLTKSILDLFAFHGQV